MNSMNGRKAFVAGVGLELRRVEDSASLEKSALLPRGE
jgi:hypothetical protein